MLRYYRKGACECLGTSNSIVLNRVFTRNTLLELLSGENCDTYDAVIRNYVKDASEKSNERIFCEIYRFLETTYQNEYYFKNTLLNKLLLGVHSTNTTTALTEVPVAKSKADFILINGKAVVYEVKSALDNFERLRSQLSDYYKAFSYVSVITCEDSYHTLSKILEGTPTGICVLTKRKQISQRKVAEEYTNNLDSTTIFKVLTKPEYETILLDVFGNLPKTSQFEYYRTCKKLFCSIDIQEAHKLFTAILKKRNSINAEKYKAVPYELKYLVYFSKLNDESYDRLFNFLRQKERKLCIFPT